MKFTREFTATLTVRSVDAASIRIGEETYRHAVALSPDRVYPDWPQKPVADLSIDDFEALLDGSPELLILGTGSQTEFAPRELMFAFARRGIGLEVMDSAAAARTFNVLAGEGRKVVSAIYLG